MTLSRHGKRKVRSGKGLLPPNPKHWENEHNGLDLRDDLGIEPDAMLSVRGAFGLLENVQVLPHGAILAAQTYIDHLRGPGKGSWSGLAIQIDGQELVLFNDAHPTNRIRATLMEEFFHLRLGHQRSTLRLLDSDGANRSYDAYSESEAYCSGAAALVPYCPLKRMLLNDVSPRVIALHFGVSVALVQFRRKICRLYRQHRS